MLIFLVVFISSLDAKLSLMGAIYFNYKSNEIIIKADDWQAPCSGLLDS
jgi:hypothetical protein